MRRELPFISPDFIQELVAEGGMTEVVAVNSMPHQLKNEGEGRLVKVYNYPLAKMMADGGEFRSAEEAREYLERLMFDIPDERNIDDVSLVERAAILKERQDAFIQFLHGELPEAVPKSMFIIAADDSGTERVFELQKEIDGFYLAALKNLKVLSGLSQEAQTTLNREVGLFEQKVEQLVKEADGHPEYPILDLKPGNIGVDKDGHIRIVDSNVALPVKNKRIREKMSPSIVGALHKLRLDIKEILDLLSTISLKPWMIC